MSNKAFIRWTLIKLLREFREGIATPEEVLEAIEALIDAKRTTE